jgi:hypothetical protein
MRLNHPFWRAHPLVLAIVATIGAAGLVLYFQYRAIATLESQTDHRRQVSEQAVTRLPASCIERSRSGAHVDGGESARSAGWTHRLGGAGIQEGLAAYPHVDRFVAWSTGTETTTPRVFWS